VLGTYSVFFLLMVLNRLECTSLTKANKLKSWSPWAIYGAGVKTAVFLWSSVNKGHGDECPLRTSSRYEHVLQLCAPLTAGRDDMSIGTILLIIVILLLIGVIPAWPHSRGWGYGPSGGLGLVLIILLILVLMGRL
jgi:hypothetical protein